MSTSQENFVPSQISAETQNCDNTKSPDEKTSIVRPSKNECSIRTNIQPPGANEPSFNVNVHEISDIPTNHNRNYDLCELSSKFSNLDINSTAESVVENIFKLYIF